MIFLLLLFIPYIINKKVFEETTIKNLHFKNRIFRGAVFDSTQVNGKMTEEGLKFYEDLAKTEVGSIITGTICVEPRKGEVFGMNGFFRIYSDEFIPEFQKLTSVVHKYNTNIFAQISILGFTDDFKLQGPSALFNQFYNMTSVEVTKSEILNIEDMMANAALRAKKAGFDGIEFPVAHWGFYSLFLGEHYNRRNDEYGGNDYNRARIVVETIEKIREKVGNDFFIILKINGKDIYENGITEEGFITTCQLAEKAGVDLIEVSGAQYKIERPKKGKPLFLDRTLLISEHVNIPVMLIGGIRNLNTMEELLKTSKIEYFGVTRPIMCEPDIIRYWKTKGERKSKCVSCNKCFDNNHQCIFDHKPLC